MIGLIWFRFNFFCIDENQSNERMKINQIYL